MINQQRRDALKVIGGAGMSAALISTPALAALTTATHTTLPTPAPRIESELEITIVNTSSLLEDTVILTNNTETDLIVHRFMPGTIVFNDRIVTLNSLSANNPVIIKAGRHASSTVKVCQLLSTPGIDEYVWADEAVNSLSETTDIVTLGAFMADGKAIVYPIAASPGFVA